jgi:two-component system chemotaxis sensor kinase CheA
MDEKEEQFRARLRETFRLEAIEHLEAISAGLLAIERAGDAERGSIVERVFREAHSFKGAARAVGVAGAEALCAELENIFAAMKRGELRLSAQMLDAIHPALGVLAALSDSPGAPPLSEGREEELRALAALRRIVRDAAAEGAAAPAPSATSRPSAVGAHSSGCGAAPGTAGAPRAEARRGCGRAGFGSRLDAEAGRHPAGSGGAGGRQDRRR